MNPSTVARLSRVVTLGLALMLAGPSVYAQADAASQLSLRDAVQLALKQNPDLQTARLEVDRADARVSEAWGNVFPTIDFSGRYTRTLKRPVFFASFAGEQTEIEIGSDHALDLALTGRQILFNGAVFVGVGAAKVYSQLSRDLYQGKMVETVAKVRKAYYGALLSREVVNMMRSNLKNAEDNLKNVQLMKKQGIVSEFDELRASVQVENLRPAVMQSENNFELSLDALRNTIGVDKGTRFTIADSLVLEDVDEDLLVRAEELAIASNPNLKAVNNQIELNGAAVSAERSNYLPTIAAFGQYQYQAAKNRFDFSTNDLIGSAQVGLALSLNIFQGLQTNARVEQAQIEQQKSEEQKTILERTLKTGVHSVVGTIRQAKKRIEAQDRTVETAERGYRIAAARFAVNSATQLDVNDAQLALTQSKVNRIQAMYDYLVAAADLDHMLGRFPAYVTPEPLD